MLAAAANATATPAPARHAGARMATVGVPFAPARTRRTVQVRERLERDSMVQIRHAFRAQTAGLARENDEDGLGDFLGQMRVAHLPQRRRMDERHMTFHELRKGGLGLQKFKFAEGVMFEWSHDCSKPRTDAFGGGAAFVTTDQIKTFTTSEWLQQVIGKRKHRFNPDTLCCTKCGKHSDAVESTICLP